MLKFDPRPSHPRRLLVGLALALQLAACGSSSTTPAPTGTASPGPSESTAPSAAPSSEPPALLLEVTTEGGFINPSASIAALPAVVVDADGRIYTPADGGDGVGAPLVPPVTVRDVGPDGAAAILAAIRAAGLDRESTGGIVADMGSTVFTVVIDGETIVSRFASGGAPGLAGGAGGPGAPGGEGQGAAAFDRLSRLSDPTVAWGHDTGRASAYVPDGYRIYDAPGAQRGGDAGSPITWPLPTGLADFGTLAVPDLGVPGLRSGIISGEPAAALAPVLASASATTEFISQGQAYSLWVRPLFPDELGG